MTDAKEFEKIMNFLEKIVFGMCIAYGFILLFVHFSLGSMMISGFLDPVTIGLIFFLIGIYPFARKRSLERVRRRRWVIF